MKIALPIFLFITVSLQAQFAIIQDKDGFVNVRKSESLNSKIVKQLPSGSIVQICSDDCDKYWPDIYYGNGNDEMGYVYYDRIKRIEEFKNIKPSIATEKKVIFKTQDYEISISMADFDKNKHQFTKGKNGEILRIDGYEFLGTDGEMPHFFEIKSFEIKYRGQPISIPPKYIKGVYELEGNDFHLVYNKDLNQYYLYASYAIGAGAFDVIWVLENGKIINYFARLSPYV